MPTAEVGRPIPWVFGFANQRSELHLVRDLRTNRKGRRRSSGTTWVCILDMHRACGWIRNGLVWRQDVLGWVDRRTTYGTVINQQNLYGGNSIRRRNLDRIRRNVWRYQISRRMRTWNHNLARQ